MMGFSQVPRGERTGRGGSEGLGSGYWKEEIKEVEEHWYVYLFLTYVQSTKEHKNKE